MQKCRKNRRLNVKMVSFNYWSNVKNKFDMLISKIFLFCRYHYMKPPRIYYVSLKVGSREFIGEGNTRQVARHCAATKALEILRSLPMPDSKPMKDGKEEVKEEKKSEAQDGV